MCLILIYQYSVHHLRRLLKNTLGGKFHVSFLFLPFSSRIPAPDSQTPLSSPFLSPRNPFHRTVTEELWVNPAKRSGERYQLPDSPGAF